MKNKRQLLIILAIVLVASLFVCLWWSGSIQPKLGDDEVIVNFIVVPKDAKIYIDDQEVKTKSVVKKGQHNVIIERFGFKTHKETFIFQQNTEVPVPLSPVTEEASAWVNKNQRLYLEVEAKVGKIAAESGEKDLKENPILSQLPVRLDPYYRLGYTYRDNKLYITVRSNDQTRAFAVNKINEISSQTAEYHYLFYDTQTGQYSENPFQDLLKTLK